jgi:hypothetical protein
LKAEEEEEEPEE